VKITFYRIQRNAFWKGMVFERIESYLKLCSKHIFHDANKSNFQAQKVPVQVQGQKPASKSRTKKPRPFPRPKRRVQVLAQKSCLSQVKSLLFTASRKICFEKKEGSNKRFSSHPCRSKRFFQFLSAGILKTCFP
jgi:hypothetical protein